MFGVWRITAANAGKRSDILGRAVEVERRFGPQRECQILLEGVAAAVKNESACEKGGLPAGKHICVQAQQPALGFRQTVRACVDGGVHVEDIAAWDLNHQSRA